MVSVPCHIWWVITVLLNYKYVYIWSTPPDFLIISGIQISTWDTVCTYIRCVKIHCGSTGKKDIIFPTVIVQFNNKHSCHNSKARSLHSEVTRIPASCSAWKKELVNIYMSLHLLNIILLVFKNSVQWPLWRAKDGKEERNPRNDKQVKHFTWGKRKPILIIFKSTGCLSGEEDHQALGDPSPNPTSVLVILDKSFSSLITIFHFFPAQAKDEHTRLPRFMEDLHTDKDQKDKENARSTSARLAAEAALALLLLTACCPPPSLLAHSTGTGCWRAFGSTALRCQTSLWKLGHESRGLKTRQTS